MADRVRWTALPVAVVAFDMLLVAFGYRAPDDLLFLALGYFLGCLMRCEDNDDG
jgi:hypothetical protein